MLVGLVNYLLFFNVGHFVILVESFDIEGGAKGYFLFVFAFSLRHL